MATSDAKPLVLFDIDNTLLSPMQYFGSDQWFGDVVLPTYFAGLAPGSPEFMSRKAKAVDLLYRAQKSLDLSLTETSLPAEIKSLQKLGVPMFAFTKRDSRLAEHSARLLLKNGIDFAAAAPGQEQDGIAGPGQDPIEYRSGILLTSGNSKGKALLALLQRLNYRPKAVIFVDDTRSNLDSVASALNGSGIAFYAYRYAGQDAKVNALKNEKVRALARVQLKNFLREGRIISNAEAAKLSKTEPVSHAEEETLIFGN